MYFLHHDRAVVESRLNQIDQHFSLPKRKTKSYSKIIETQDNQYGFFVKLFGKYNASSFFGDGELIDYTPPPEPDPEEQTEEIAE
jgi:hypothetical protein